MTNVIYNIDTPDGPNNPSQDQPKMKMNTNSLKSLIEIDHIGFGNNQGGYHQTIHQPQLGVWTQAGRTAAPPLTPIAGVNQIIAMNVTPDSMVTSVDTQLFSMTGASNGTTDGVYQLTGLNISANDGYGWCAGILFQWGRATSVFAVNTVTFKDRFPGAIAFPNACFGVVCTPLSAGVPSNNLAVAVGSVTKTSFVFSHSSTGSNTFFWVAIGI